MLKLLPRDETFFELLEQLAGHIVICVGHLERITQTFPNVNEPVQRIEEEELIADELTQSELRHLDSAFITPIDREDILHLMTDLYSVVETIADLAQRFKRYNLKQLDPEFATQVKAFRGVAESLQEVILHLRKGHQLSELNDKMQQMHRMKKRADGELYTFLTLVFADSSNPLEVMKRKELHDLMEKGIDGCANVNKTLQRTILKNN
jgi:uncharacterized protein Yka (UPF0111/DUF47 family)